MLRPEDAGVFLCLIAMTMTSALQAAARIVVVTATAGFRHDSIATAETVIEDIGATTKWFSVSFARTEEEMLRKLSADRLVDVNVVMFVNTTGEAAAAVRPNLLRWVEEGGSFLGVHSASDTWHASAEYIAMLGGEFNTHPDQIVVDVYVEDRAHPATATLQSPHALFEEYYLFRSYDPARVRLLLSLHSSPVDGAPGLYPLAWTRDQGGGRVFYTALGHRIDVWTSEWFRQHLTGAIAWALRRDQLPTRTRPARR